MAETWERFKIIDCRFCRRSVRYDKIENKTLELIGDEPHVCPRKQKFCKDRGFRTAQNKRDAK